MTAAERLEFTDIESLLDWAYKRQALRPRSTVISYEPGLKTTDPSEPSTLELSGEGCGPRAIVNELMRGIDQTVILAEFIYPWDDVLRENKEYRIKQLAGHWFQHSRARGLDGQFVIDRMRYYATRNNPELTHGGKRGYWHHSLDWWAKHTGKPLGTLKWHCSSAQHSIGNFYTTVRSIALLKADALMRERGHLKST